jgi:hypothetical protein
VVQRGRAAEPQASGGAVADGTHYEYRPDWGEATVGQMMCQ